MPSSPMFHLTGLLRQACQDGKSINQLVQEINDLTKKNQGSGRVNRRLLKMLKEGCATVGLTLEVAVAMTEYFRTIKLIKDDPQLFAYEALIDNLVRVSQVHFLYGAKPRPKERRVDVSRWDLDAGAHVLTAASRACTRCEFDSNHVLWHNPASLQSVQGEPWLRVLDDDEHSVVSIGSPLASLSTEVMLARMFGVKEPFQTPDPTALSRLPFWYCWSPVVAEKFRSAFALTPAELKLVAKDIAARVDANESHAFGLGDKVYEVPRTGKAWQMPGIVAAQRRPKGNLWLVVSGVAGPATCAAAKLVPEIRAMLPWQPQQVSPVLWVPVIAHVKEGAANPARGDIRELDSVHLAGPPHLYP